MEMRRRYHDGRQQSADAHARRETISTQNFAREAKEGSRLVSEGTVGSHLDDGILEEVWLVGDAEEQGAKVQHATNVRLRKEPR